MYPRTKINLIATATVQDAAIKSHPETKHNGNWLLAKRQKTTFKARFTEVIYGGRDE